MASISWEGWKVTPRKKINPRPDEKRTAKRPAIQVDTLGRGSSARLSTTSRVDTLHRSGSEATAQRTPSPTRGSPAHREETQCAADAKRPRAPPHAHRTERSANSKERVRFGDAKVASSSSTTQERTLDAVESADAEPRLALQDAPSGNAPGTQLRPKSRLRPSRKDVVQLLTSAAGSSSSARPDTAVLAGDGTASSTPRSPNEATNEARVATNATPRMRSTSNGTGDFARAKSAASGTTPRPLPASRDGTSDFARAKSAASGTTPRPVPSSNDGSRVFARAKSAASGTTPRTLSASKDGTRVYSRAKSSASGTTPRSLPTSKDGTNFGPCAKSAASSTPCPHSFERKKEGYRRFQTDALAGEVRQRPSTQQSGRTPRSATFGGRPVTADASTTPVANPWKRQLAGYEKHVAPDMPASLPFGKRLVPELQEDGNFAMVPRDIVHVDKGPEKEEASWPKSEVRDVWALEQPKVEVSEAPTAADPAPVAIRASTILAHTEFVEESEEDKGWKRDARTFFKNLKLYVHKLLEPTYTMYVIHVNDFENMGSLRSHEELLAEGDILHDLFQLEKKTSFCIFCVHEWLDYRQPDPYKIHYRTALSYANEKMEAMEELGSKTQVYVWVDYCCLPTTRSIGQKDIPCYIARSDSLVVVSPFYRHSCGRVCDSKSFYRRGWCTLEILCSICFSCEEHHQYVTHDGNFPGTALGSLGRSTLLQSVLEVNPLRRNFGCCEVNHVQELALSEVSKSDGAKSVREFTCDRKNLSYALVAAYAFALYKAIHLHGKFGSEDLAMVLKQGRGELLESVVPETLAEFSESTGEHLLSAEDFSRIIDLAKDSELPGTRYNTSMKLSRTSVVQKAVAEDSIKERAGKSKSVRF